MLHRGWRDRATASVDPPLQEVSVERSRMVDHRRFATSAGVAAPIVAVGAILLATIVATPETFTWKTRALSDLGRPGTRTFGIFNGGLIIGGLIGVPFVWRVWNYARDYLQQAGTLALAGSLLGMIGVGVFFLEHTTYYLASSLHGIAALTTFTLAPIAALLYGSGAARTGQRRIAIWSLASGILALAGWATWISYLQLWAPFPSAWFAVAEYFAGLCFGGWILRLAVADWNRSWSGDA